MVCSCHALTLTFCLATVLLIKVGAAADAQMVIEPLGFPAAPRGRPPASHSIVP